METKIKIFVAPRAKKNAVSGYHNGEVKVQVAAPPTEGRANKELVSFIAKKLSVARKDVSIISGASSRHKTIKIIGINSDSAISGLLDSK